MLNWLNANAGAVQAISAVVVAIFTVILVWATLRYVKLTSRLAKSAEANTDQTRTIFEATHRPIISTSFGLNLCDPNAFDCACTVNNVGNSPATDVCVEIGSSGDLYHARFQFGDLTNGQQRSIKSLVPSGQPLMRWWYRELEEQSAVTLKYTNTYRSRLSGTLFTEPGVIKQVPSPSLVMQIKSLGQTR